jgi:hypothetical protein
MVSVRQIGSINAGIISRYCDGLQNPEDVGSILIWSKKSIHEREGFAPAVLAYIAGDHLAGSRAFEQRAVGTTINAIWRVLILRLLPRHFFVG